jgi:hypothetical protein
VAVAASRDAGAVDAAADGGAEATDASQDQIPREAGGARRKPGDLRAYGPENSRLTALLRLDRLRSSPGKDGYVAAVDRLLRLLPDRRRLIEGTGLDLYRDFDALLIATPDPTDVAVTFLAARHHLKDAALMAALAKGAAAAGRPIEWRQEDGRPVGVRPQAPGAPGKPVVLDRDDRIFVLPQPSLAVMAPPVYAQRLLGTRAGPTPGPGSDAGSEDASQPRKGRISWSELVARIDAENSALPEDAVFMLTVLLETRAPARSLVVPGTRGTVDDDLPPPAEPRRLLLTVVAAIEPTPLIDLYGEFESEREAVAWERDLPGFKRKILTNPLLLLGGFAALVDRAELSRDASTIAVHISATPDELQRLLNLAANLTRSAATAPR